MSTPRIVAVMVAVLAFGALVARPGTAIGGTIYTVNSTIDEPNATLGSPVCNSTPSNVCTLRAAIMAANANPGADTISIPGDIFRLTISGTDNVAQVGDLDITGDVTIQGAGVSLTTIDGSLLSPGDRIFNIHPPAHVTMSDLTISNGSTNPGSAIRIGDPTLGGATLNISNCAVQNNGASTPPSRGGGLFNANAASSLTVTNCSFSGNKSSYGGAIENSGSLTVTGSQFTNNTTDTEGGAIESSAGTASITNTTFSMNNSFNGSGIANGGGTMTVSGGSITANHGGFGGGVLNDATMTITNTTVSGNVGNGSNGGGIANRGTLSLNGVIATSNNATYYGGGISNQGTATLVNSTISGNSAAYGGGIGNIDGTTNAANSTVSGNSAATAGGGIDNFGNTNLYNVTVAYNGIGTLSGPGGGINSAGGTVTLQNSLVAWNYYQGIINKVYISDCTITSPGTLSSGGYNLVRVDCGFTHQTGDQVGTFSFPLDPKISALANNGGPTQTHALLAGSPAIDAGNPAGCKDNSGTLLTADQRGYPRPVDGGSGHAYCDIGAYEYGAAATPTPSPTPTPAPTPSPTPTPTPTPSPGITPTPTATPPGETPTPTGETPSPTEAATATPTPTRHATPSPVRTPGPSGSPEERIWADLLCGGADTAVGALDDLRDVAGFSPLTPTNPCPAIGATVEVQGFSPHTWGDVNCDGQITAVDSLDILRNVAGLSQLPKTGHCPDIGQQVTVTG